MPAPEGNQNAKKPDAKHSMLRVRVRSQDKAHWVRAAQAAGSNLATWVIDRLNKASGKDPEE